MVDDVSQDTAPTLEAGDLDTMTLSNAVIRANPNGYYRAMRDWDPIHFDEGIGMYLVSRYDLLEEVLRDPI